MTSNHSSIRLSGFWRYMRTSLSQASRTALAGFTRVVLGALCLTIMTACSPTAAGPTEVTAGPTEATAEPTEATAEPTEATAEPTEATAEPTEATAGLFDKISDFLGQGKALIVLCSEPKINNCNYFGTVDPTSQPVKWDIQHLPPEIGNDKLRSLLMICGAPTAILVYRDAHFMGTMDVYHCSPDSILEIRDMGYMDEVTSSMVFTSDYYAPGPASEEKLGVLNHTAVDLSRSVGSFRTKIEQGFEAREDIEDVTVFASQVFWTDAANMNERYRYPDADTWMSWQLVQFTVDMDLDPNWWPFDYRVVLSWYLYPTTLGTVDKCNNRYDLRNDSGRKVNFGDSQCLAFEVWGWDLWVEGGKIADKIFSGIYSEMTDIGKQIGDGIVNEIRNIALQETGIDAGILVLQGIERIGWTISDPKPCNRHAWFPVQNCNWYRAVPPMLVLHKDDHYRLP